MKMAELIDQKDHSSAIDDFLVFASHHLDLPSAPQVQILQEPIYGKESNSFAAYSPPNKKILIYVGNRHLMDVFRSLAHELVHYRQDLSHQLTADSGKTGSPEENEANAIAGQIMRLYGRQHPELF